MGDLIEFPVERRTPQVQGALAVALGGEGNYSFFGGNATAYSVASESPITFTGAGVAEIVAPPPPLELDGPQGESWWARVPDVEWAKLGFFPQVTARQHRLVDVVVTQLGGGLVLAALVVCGRRGVLSPRFDENVSGGHCRRCRAK